MARMTPLRARIFRVLSSLVTLIPKTLPDEGSCRTRPDIRCFKRICTPAFRAAASSGRTSPTPEEVVAATAGSTALPVCIWGQAMAAAWFSRGAEIPYLADSIGGFFHKNDAVGDEPFVGWRAVVGKSPNDFFVVVAVVGETVRFDDRPIGEIAKQDVRRILDAVLLLPAGAAAQGDVAAAQHGVAANVKVRVDQDDRRAVLNGFDSGGETRGARRRPLRRPPVYPNAAPALAPGLPPRQHRRGPPCPRQRPPS